MLCRSNPVPAARNSLEKTCRAHLESILKYHGEWQSIPLQSVSKLNWISDSVKYREGVLDVLCKWFSYSLFIVDFLAPFS